MMMSVEKLLFFCMIVIVTISLSNGIPIFGNIPGYIEAPEDTANGTLLNIFTVTVDNGDTLSSIKCTIEDTCNLVYVNHTQTDTYAYTVYIYKNGVYDRDYAPSQRNLYFTATAASNPDNTATRMIPLFIKDVNDNPPRFQNLPYQTSIQENAAIGTTLNVNIYATDPDNGVGGTVSYSMEPNKQNKELSKGVFIIDRYTGKVTVNGSIDYETLTFFQYNVSAYDGGNMTAYTDLIIKVLDLQDQPPFFQRLTYLTTIKENSAMSHIGNTVTNPSVVKTTTPAPLSERHDILCEADTITAFLPEDLLPVGAKLTWRNPNCTLISNSSHFLSTISHNQCGTTVNITTDSVVYKNEISLSIRSNITSDSTNIFNPMVDFGDVPAVIPVTCIYPRKQVSMLSYQPLPSVVKFYESRTGNFEIKMEMYKTNLFRDVLQDPPVRVRLQSDVNMRVSLVENSGKLDLRLEKCIATTSPLPYDSQVYTLIENGCPAQSHVKILPSPATEARFSIKAFQFLSNRSAQVYIHCEASVCITGSSDCATNCGNQNRQKRDLSQNRHSHLISTGPLVLEADKESDLQASTVLAGVFAVVAFGAIILAVVGWRRKPTANKVDKS